MKDKFIKIRKHFFLFLIYRHDRNVIQLKTNGFYYPPSELSGRSTAQ